MDNVSISDEMFIRYPNLENAIAGARQRAGARIDQPIRKFMPLTVF
jgi:hypothetical protein